MRKPVIILAKSNSDASETHLKYVDAEIDAIEEALRPFVLSEELVVVKLAAANYRSIIETFQDYRDRVVGFHYSGHSNSYDLLLKGDDGIGDVSVPSTGIASFLMTQEGLELIFLNGCSTLRQAEIYYDSNYSNIIVTNKHIHDEVAFEVARHFYIALAKGASVKQAFKEAKKITKTKATAKGIRDLIYEGAESFDAEGEVWKLIGKGQWTPFYRQIPYIGEPRKVYNHGRVLSEKDFNFATEDKPAIIGGIMDCSQSMFKFLDSNIDEFEQIVDYLEKVQEQHPQSPKGADVFDFFLIGFGTGNITAKKSFFSSLFQTITEGFGESVKSLLPSDFLGLTDTIKQWDDIRRDLNTLGVGVDSPMLQALKYFEVKLKNRIEQDFPVPTMLLISDGDATDGSIEEVVTQANKLKELGVLIITCFFFDGSLLPYKQLPSTLPIESIDNSSVIENVETMYYAASTIPSHPRIQGALKEHQWHFTAESKLFIHINDENNIAELIKAIASI